MNQLERKENHDIRCPVCGKDVYFALSDSNYACIDPDCKMAMGATNYLHQKMIEDCYPFSVTPRPL